MRVTELKRSWQTVGIGIIVACAPLFLTSCACLDGMHSGKKVVSIRIVSPDPTKYHVQVRQFGDVESTVVVDSKGLATVTIPSMRYARSVFLPLPFLGISYSQETDTEILILEGSRTRKVMRLDRLLRQTQDVQKRYLIEMKQ